MLEMTWYQSLLTDVEPLLNISNFSIVLGVRGSIESHIDLR